VERRRIVEIGSLAWAAIGASVALAALPSVNDDAIVLVGVASVVFPLCALGAALALRDRRDRLAGLLLLASVATPTYFAYALNLPALAVGLALLAAPSATLGGRRHTTPTAVPGAGRRS
jgi:hypothetical protein